MNIRQGKGVQIPPLPFILIGEAIKMVKKMNHKVEFCGKERKFQRCPNRTLRDYQKSIEDIQDKLTPLAERQRDFQFKLTELEEEIESFF